MRDFHSGRRWTTRGERLVLWGCAITAGLTVAVAAVSAVVQP